MFPVGNLLKGEVKRIAAEIGLSEIARKKESMGICFVGKRNFKEFMSEYISPKPGELVDFDTGKVIGSHDGIHMFTLGQKILMGGSRQKLYILRKMPDMKTILVAGGHDNEAFYSDLIFADVPHWIGRSPFGAASVVELKFCFQHTDPLEDCRVVRIKGGLLVFLRKPLRAITPGQFAVFYSGDECLGGAKITSTCPILSDESRQFIRHKSSSREKLYENRIRKCSR